MRLASGVLFHRQGMNGNSGPVRARFLTSVTLGVFCVSATAVESYVTHTNWVERAITNTIEVSMPKNVFVNQYRTNWSDRFTTNHYNVYATNHLTRSQTNKIVLEAFHTNVVDSYVTNYKTVTVTKEVPVQLFRTNVLDLYKTNVATLTLTNEVAVSLVRTNFVDQFRTNWQTLSFTNWQTVLVMRTNYITQPITNYAQVDVPIENAPSGSLRFSGRNETSSSALPDATSDDPQIEAIRTTRTPSNGQIEIQLHVKWPTNIADPVPVQQWRIESEDGAILSFGQDQEFKKELPIGNYKVEAKLLREVDKAALLLRGKLTVTTREALLQQRQAGKRLISAQ